MSTAEEPLRKIAVAVLHLPDGRVALQRRTDDAPVAPGLLGLFGGHFEGQEDALTCLKRELAEETSLNVDSLVFTRGREVVLPPVAGYKMDRHFFVFDADIASDDFEVYEGVRVESYHIKELLKRDDISETIPKVFGDVE